MDYNHIVDALEILVGADEFWAPYFFIGTKVTILWVIECEFCYIYLGIDFHLLSFPYIRRKQAFSARVRIIYITYNVIHTYVAVSTAVTAVVFRTDLFMLVLKYDQR